MTTYNWSLTLMIFLRFFSPSWMYKIFLFTPLIRVLYGFENHFFMRKKIYHYFSLSLFIFFSPSLSHTFPFFLIFFVCSEHVKTIFILKYKCKICVILQKKKVVVVYACSSTSSIICCVASFGSRVVHSTWCAFQSFRWQNVEQYGVRRHNEHSAIASRLQLAH